MSPSGPTQNPQLIYNNYHLGLYPMSTCYRLYASYKPPIMSEQWNTETISSVGIRLNIIQIQDTVK